MLVAILNFLIYNIIYSYLLTVLVNFFHPITPFASFVILSFSGIFSVVTTKFIPLSEFPFDLKKTRITLLGVIGVLILFVWLNIVIRRVSLGVDTNVYHLPLSLLINNSIWYPGIGKISSHMAFHNGTSILGSLFTSFNIPGFEFIPGFCIWVIFGMGIYLYLLKKRLNPYVSFAVASMFLLTPSFFWESYNMGTDMPAACFLTLGLLALSDRNFKDTALFLALSAVFKPAGQAAFGLFMAGYVPFLLFKGNIKKLWNFKIILSILLFAAVSLRLYIGTGNPLYPIVALKLAPWGIAIKEQASLFSGALKGPRAITMKNYQGSFFAVFRFIGNFFVFPRRINSSNWFSPFFLTCLFSSVYLFIRDKRYRNISVSSWLTVLLISVLLGSWAANATQIRFILGILVFMALILFCFSLNRKIPIILKGLIYFSLFFTLCFFTFNVTRHFKDFILPVFNVPAEEAKKQYGYYKEGIVSTVVMDDGFSYSVADSTYCGRSKPPCLHRYTIGDKDEIIERYKKYNKKFVKAQIPPPGKGIRSPAKIRK